VATDYAVSAGDSASKLVSIWAEERTLAEMAISRSSVIHHQPKTSVPSVSSARVSPTSSISILWPTFSFACESMRPKLSKQ
jgi:hypothetical protein